MLTVHAGSALDEHVENRLLRFLGHAGTGVGHPDLNPRLAFVSRWAGHDRDDTLLGELDRVGDQIQQDLLHTAHIGVDPPVEIRTGRPDQGDLLALRDRTDHLQDVADQVADVRVGLVHLQLARLEPGEVEQVVQQRRKAVGGVLDARDELPGAGIERPLQQQIDHPDDPGHRGAHVVTDRRQQALPALGQLLGVGQQAQLQIHGGGGRIEVRTPRIPKQLGQQGCHHHRDRVVRPVGARNVEHGQDPRGPHDGGQCRVPARPKHRHAGTDNDQQEVGGLPLLLAEVQVQRGIRDKDEEHRDEDQRAVGGESLTPGGPGQGQ